MLNLKLRDEFLKRNLRGTVIDFRSREHTGATEVAPEEFLKITYPTADVLKAVSCLREDNLTGPVVLMGGRGKGKSHLMAVLHHCIKSPSVAETWLSDWSSRLDDPSLAQWRIRTGYFPITEAVNSHNYNFLWDLIFERHPKGQLFKGRFQASGAVVPPRALVEEMFRDTPTCLILDEFQTWFDDLPEEHNGYKVRANAFSFTQTLSEIAKDSPDALVLIVSIRDNETEAFRQIHRQTPVLVDFSGDTAKEDRKRLILHRLFENRQLIPDDRIYSLVRDYSEERFRLLYEQSGRKTPQKVREEVCLSWPFSPELLDLLEDQILMSDAAQETRDMIRILAMVFKSCGGTSPVLTAADFSVEGGSGDVQSLVDSIATQTGQTGLRAIAKRNVEEVRESGASVERLVDMVSAIWMHSMSPDRLRGARAVDIQLALAGRRPIGDNDFNLQMQTLVDNSVNIHDDPNRRTYWFEQEVNPRAQIRVVARNDNLWRPNAPQSSTSYPGKDIDWLMRTVRACYVSPSQSPSKIVVLGPHWNEENWENELPDEEKPAAWTQQVLVVVPKPFPSTSTMNAELGTWLATRIQSRRNAVRFLVQTTSGPGLYDDRELRFMARCSYLCSPEAWGRESPYRQLSAEFATPFEKAVKDRFTHFAILEKWDFQHPERCRFARETLQKRGLETAAEIERKVEEQSFDTEVFLSRLDAAAAAGQTLAEFFDDLQEPTPGDTNVFLGEQRTLGHVQAAAAKGRVAIHADGTWHTRKAGEPEEEALARIRAKTSRSGGELRRMLLGAASRAGGGTAAQGSGGAVSGSAGSGSTPPHPASPVGSSPSGISGATAGEGGGIHPSGGSSGPSDPPRVPPPSRRRSAPASNASTLQGKFEEWGLPPNRKLRSASLSIEGISVSDLKTFLMRLPSKYRAAMEVEEEETP